MTAVGGWVVQRFGSVRPGRYLGRSGDWVSLSHAAWFDTEAEAASAAQTTGIGCGPRQLVGRPDEPT